MSGETVFDQFWQKEFTPPPVAEGKSRPWGVEQALQRLDAFFFGKPDWTIPAEGRIPRQFLLYHTSHDGQRRVRDQFHHSCLQVLKILLVSVNTQRNNGPLGFLQVRRIRITEIAELTGFARSTVIAVIRALKRAGILRTQRRKTNDHKAELVAVRWLTTSLFDMLGLGGWIKKQGHKGEQKKQEQQQQRQETPGADRQRSTDHRARMQHLSDALEGNYPQPPPDPQKGGTK